ncbi:MAG: TetR/AcrR family transcriptional regulator [Psychrilyobacter sp.]|uniref:TetR/AcrR family transcriptional regulator n=1 Tax=Psychrilyobacter sp. TaxID=2586924 RepID=UPI003C748F9B
MSKENIILKVALELFSKYGYGGVSTKQIAKESGVNEVTIFRKFETKNNLFQQVISKYAKEGNIIEKLKNDLTGTIEKDLMTFGMYFYHFLQNNELMYKIQVKQVDEKPMKFTNSLKYKQIFVEYLEEAKIQGKFKGDSEKIAVLTLSTIMGLFTFKIFTNEILKNIDIITLIEDEINRILKDYIE